MRGLPTRGRPRLASAGAAMVSESRGGPIRPVAAGVSTIAEPSGRRIRAARASAVASTQTSCERAHAALRAWKLRPQAIMPGSPPTVGRPHAGPPAPRCGASASRQPRVRRLLPGPGVGGQRPCAASNSSRRTRSSSRIASSSRARAHRLGLVAQPRQGRERAAGEAGEVVEHPRPIAHRTSPSCRRGFRRPAQPVYRVAMILVTGGAGFIGSNLHAALARAGPRDGRRRPAAGTRASGATSPPSAGPPAAARGAGRLPRQPSAGRDDLPSGRDQRHHRDRRRPGLGHQRRAAAAALALVRRARRCASSMPPPPRPTATARRGSTTTVDDARAAARRSTSMAGASTPSTSQVARMLAAGRAAAAAMGGPEVLQRLRAERVPQGRAWSRS